MPGISTVAQITALGFLFPIFSPCLFYNVLKRTGIDFYFLNFFVFFFFFFAFLGPHLRHMEVPRLGVESELQPSTYTTAHGNAGSLTQRARPGIEPLSSWMLLGFVNLRATTGTAAISFLNKDYIYFQIYIYIYVCVCVCVYIYI